MQRRSVLTFVLTFGLLGVAQSRADFPALATPDVGTLGVDVHGGLGTMVVSGMPVSLDDGSPSSPISVDMPPTPSLTVNITGLNAAGTSWSSGLLSLSSQFGGQDLSMTGNLVGLQTNALNHDLFELLFHVTSSSTYAHSLFADYVVLKLDANFDTTGGFTGSFFDVFANDGSAGVADLKRAVVPAPGAGLLVAIGLGAIRALRRRSIG